VGVQEYKEEGCRFHHVDDVAKEIDDIEGEGRNG
jgi:hypothetical protein